MLSLNGSQPISSLKKEGPSKRLVFGEDQRVAQWAADRSAHGNIWDGKFVAIGLEHNGELIAALGYTEYLAGGSVRGHISAIEGKHWMTKSFLRIMFIYPFLQLKVQRFNALIPAQNKAVKRFVEHLGFTHESTMERALANDDVLVYRMFVEDPAWKRWVMI